MFSFRRVFILIVMGMVIFNIVMMILSGGTKLDIQMLPPLFVSHILTTIAVYRNKFKPYKGKNNAKPTLHL